MENLHPIMDNIIKQHVANMTAVEIQEVTILDRVAAALEALNKKLKEEFGVQNDC